MAKAEKQTLKQQAKIRDSEQEAHSPLVSKLLPTVEKIEIVARSRVYPGGVDKSTEIICSYAPSDKAYFKIACPDRDCIAGGVDFESTVRTMVGNNDSSRSARDSCSGTLNRASRSKCALGWDYTITIAYQQLGSDNFEAE